VKTLEERTGKYFRKNHSPYRWDLAPSNQAFDFTALPALDCGLVLAHTIQMITAQYTYTQQHYKVQYKSEDEKDNFGGRRLCLELKKKKKRQIMLNVTGFDTQ
jgi:hypothetical protein